MARGMLQGLLIGGSSHCGKSTLARHIGDTLGWRVSSTDAMGRHPGRPWPTIPAPVEEFWDRLTDQTIYWFLRVHHTNFWPLLQRTIGEESGQGGFVMEGSALRPEQVASLAAPGLLAVVLHADPDFLADRIRRESGYAERDSAQRSRIDKFITRSMRDNAELADAARSHRIQLIDVADAKGLETATEHLLEELRFQSPLRDPQ